MTPARPRSMLSDGEHYDAANSFKVDDLAFWASLVGERVRVLELACGTGRIALPLARAGAEVTAIDISPSMLTRARDKPGGDAVTWIEADMRTFDAPGRYDLAILGFNAINLLEVDDAITCLARVARCLARHGRLVIDTFLPNPSKLEAAELALPPYRVGDVEVRVTARRTYDPAQQRRRLELAIWSSDRADPEHDAFDLHVYFPSELRLVIERAGFSVVERFGGYDRSPLTATSSTQIVVCEVVGEPSARATSAK